MQHKFVQQELEQKQQELDALTTRIQNLEDVSILHNTYICVKAATHKTC